MKKKNEIHLDFNLSVSTIRAIICAVHKSHMCVRIQIQSYIMHNIFYTLFLVAICFLLLLITMCVRERERKQSSHYIFYSKYHFLLRMFDTLLVCSFGDFAKTRKTIYTYLFHTQRPITSYQF